jgi:O-antigen/teichoic acid export membrane protein
MHLLYPASGVYDGRVFAWVMSCLPAYSLMYVYSTLLTANGALRLLNIQAGCAALLNLLLNVLFIPKYGAEGAAVVAFITQWSIAGSTLFFATKRNALPVHYRWIGAHLGYAILLILVGCGAYTLWHDAWLLVTAVISVAAAILIFAFRFITPAALGQFLSRR